MFLEGHIQLIPGRKFRYQVKKSEEREGCFANDSISPFSAKYTMVLGRKTLRNWRRRLFSCTIRYAEQIKDQVPQKLSTCGNSLLWGKCISLGPIGGPLLQSQRTLDKSFLSLGLEVFVYEIK